MSVNKDTFNAPNPPQGPARKEYEQGRMTIPQIGAQTDEWQSTRWIGYWEGRAGLRTTTQETFPFHDDALHDKLLKKGGIEPSHWFRTPDFLATAPHCSVVPSPPSQNQARAQDRRG